MSTASKLFEGYAWPGKLRAEGGGTLSLYHLAGGLGGAVIGFAAGELLNALLKGRIHNILLVGLYFAQLALFILLGLALSERLRPSLHPDNRMASPGRFCLLLPLIGLGVFFVLGCLFQLIYGLTPVKTALQQADDYIIAIDNSGSTYGSDPDKSRFSAVTALFSELGEEHRAAVIVFDDQAEEVVPLGAVNSGFRSNAAALLSQFEPDGGTDIEAALLLAERLHDPSRSSMVILLSDGLSSVNVRAITDSYTQKDIVLNTVGFAYSRFGGTRLLQRLSDMTGGTYYQVDDITQLSGAMSQAASSKAPERSLLSYRHGRDRNNAVSLIERILFVALLTLALCLVLGLAAGEPEIALFYLPQKAVCAVLAGLAMELGLLAFLPEASMRLLSALLMGLFLARYRNILETDHYGEFASRSPLTAERLPVSAGAGTRIGVSNRPSDF